MRQLRALALRLRSLFGSARAAAAFCAELETHIALPTDAGIRAGLRSRLARLIATAALCPRLRASCRTCVTPCAS